MTITPSTRSRFLAKLTSREGAFAPVSPIEVIFGAVVLCLVGFSLGLTLPILIFYVLGLGANPAIATLVFAALSLTSFLTAPLWGKMCDRLGVRVTMILSLCGLCVAYFWLSMVSTWQEVFGSRIMHGLFSGLMPAVLALASRVHKHKKRTQLFGLFGATFATGLTLGPGFSIILLPSAPPQSAISLAIYHDILFLAFGACCVALVFASVFHFMLMRANHTWMPPPSHDPHTPHVSSHTNHQQRHGDPDPALSRVDISGDDVSKTFDQQSMVKEKTSASMNGVYIALGIGLLVLAMFTAVETGFALWSQQALNATPRDTGILIFMAGTANIFTQGGLINVVTRYFSIAIGRYIAITTIMVGMLLMSLNAWPAVYCGVIALGIGIGLWMPLLQNSVSMVSPPNHIGRSMGYYQSTNHLARILGPLWSGWAVTQLWPNALLLIGVAGLIAAMIALVFINRHDASLSKSKVHQVHQVHQKQE